MSTRVVAQFITARPFESWRQTFIELSFFFLWTRHFDFQTNGPRNYCSGRLLNVTSSMTLIILASQLSPHVTPQLYSIFRRGRVHPGRAITATVSKLAVNKSLLNKALVKGTPPFNAINCLSVPTVKLVAIIAARTLSHFWQTKLLQQSEANQQSSLFVINCKCKIGTDVFVQWSGFSCK